MIVMNGTTNGLLMPWVITIEFVEVQPTPSFFIDASQGSVECCQVLLDVLMIYVHVNRFIVSRSFVCDTEMTIQSCSYFFRIKENPSANLVEWNQTPCLPFQEGSLVRTRLRRKHNANAFLCPDQNSGRGNAMFMGMALIGNHVP